ncbi:MAG: GMC family oxidoreductase [Comamonas sp.]
MAKTLPKKDVVVVGFGWTGAILSKELTEAGLNVVALERGPMQDTDPDGVYPQTMDELTFNSRRKLFVDVSKETVTIRHTHNDVALPNRQLGAFLPGNGVGGAGLHWSGVHFRVDPMELRMRSHYEERYGKKFIPEDMTIQDFGVTYDELEPSFDFAEKVFGTSGSAWTVQGQRMGAGGNFFAPDRSNDFPLPAQKNSVSASLFGAAAESLGFHPYNMPSANTSGPYTNPYGAQMGPCNFCGFCSGYACYMYSKASPNVNILPALRLDPRFELRAQCQVTRVNKSADGKSVTGVTYIDSMGQEVFQPADIVALCMFQFNNVRMLLLSDIGKPYDPVSNTGVVGRNFAFQNMATIKVFFDKSTHTTNPFMGAGGNGIAIDDFNAGNFDHGAAGFVGGSPFWLNQGGTKPIAASVTPPGVASWGSEWKKSTADHYTHHVSMDAHGAHQSYRGNYLSLDPTYKDAYGNPLLRMTLDWQPNDIKMNMFMADKMSTIAKAMGGHAIGVYGKKPGTHFDTSSYQTTHLNGGAVMGTDPNTSAVNRYLQNWDAHNLFVLGASAFPQGLGYNPTGLVAALAYWSAKAIRTQYLKQPGALLKA